MLENLYPQAEARVCAPRFWGLGNIVSRAETLQWPQVSHEFHKKMKYTRKGYSVELVLAKARDWAVGSCCDSGPVPTGPWALQSLNSADRTLGSWRLFLAIRQPRLSHWLSVTLEHTVQQTSCSALNSRGDFSYFPLKTLTEAWLTRKKSASPFNISLERKEK